MIVSITFDDGLLVAGDKLKGADDIEHHEVAQILLHCTPEEVPLEFVVNMKALVEEAVDITMSIPWAHVKTYDEIVSTDYDKFRAYIANGRTKTEARRAEAKEKAKADHAMFEELLRKANEGVGVGQEMVMGFGDEDDDLVDPSSTN